VNYNPARKPMNLVTTRTVIIMVVLLHRT